MLSQEAVRKRLVHDSIAIEPAAVIAQIGAEDHADDGQIGRVVPLDRLGIRQMVPMVNVRCREHIGQRPEALAGIRVDQETLNPDPDHIRAEKDRDDAANPPLATAGSQQSTMGDSVG